MSRWLDHADALAAHLTATVSWCSAATHGSAAVPVFVDRQKELVKALTQTAAKVKGASIVILWGGAKNPDPKSNTLRMGAEFTVFVMTKPLFRDTFVTCDDLTEAVAEAMHDWTPAQTVNHPTQRLQVEYIAIAPHEALTIYEIAATIQRLPAA